MGRALRRRKEPHGAEAPGNARTPASAKPCLSGNLSAYSKGPASMVSMPRSENSMRIDFLSHSCTTTSSVEGSTSATLACPVSRSSMASSTNVAASLSAGESSSRRSHSSSMLACRSAMAHPSETLTHQRETLHRLDQRDPHVTATRVAVEVAGAHQEAPVCRQRPRHRPRVGPAAGGDRDPEVEATLWEGDRAAVGLEHAGEKGQPVAIASSLRIDMGVVAQRGDA